MAIINAIASVAVRDLDTAAAWYERILGRPADSRPIPELAEWKFQRGGWLQVYEQPQRAGTGSVTRPSGTWKTRSRACRSLVSIPACAPPDRSPTPHDHGSGR
jgi:hypothetical protein